MTPAAYLTALNQLLSTGRAREHAYRGDLQLLLKTILPEDYDVINEPSQIRGVGNPDFLVRNADGVAIGYLEAKDIGKDLDHKDYREQFDRYRKGLDNLIITDYLRFDFYQSGQLVHTVRIGELHDKLAKPLGENYDTFVNLLRDFGQYVGEPIRGPKRLAELMAGKARLLQDILHRAVQADIEVDNQTTLRQQFNTFRDVLIHDLEPKQFSDLYAQTLAYGLFAARLHDESLENFSRQEAGELIPRSNPFLRQLFGYVAGYDIDSRIKATVDNLADIFLHADVRALMTDYGRSTQQTDAVVHFYETFLAEYDPALRKARGVWYTPQPVVDFIVRAVDDILKTEFGLKDGLADNSKIKVKRKVMTKATADRRSKLKEVEVEEKVHRVQILDPATGTGTFLAAVIQYVYDKNFKMMPGAWPDYVEQHLIPRLNGFELLMASYAMAHLKLDLQLRGTGYTRELGQRFKVYLTNSLEEDHPDTGTLFASFLSNEANEANAIKRDTPVMCVIGNPPYSVSSSNKSEFIQNLLQDYKKNLNERKINLDDDYIKFIRLAQHYIETTKEGILAFITNRSYLNGLTHRRIRENLLSTFNKLHILDLGGSALLKANSDVLDENVFDIMQGVAICVLVKKRNTDSTELLFKRLYGGRKDKYGYLSSHSIGNLDWLSVTPKSKNFFFNDKNYDDSEIYENGFLITNLFCNNSTGIESQKDDLIINNTYEEAESLVNQLKTLSESEFRKTYPNIKDGRDWKVNYAIDEAKHSDVKVYLTHHRPFDARYFSTSGKSKGITAYPRWTTMFHFTEENVGLLVPRQTTQDWRHVFIVNSISDGNLLSTSKKTGSANVFPLYLYSTGEELNFQTTPRRPNLDEKIVAGIAEGLGLRFTPEKEDDPATFAPIDLLDYIYAVLHDPAYRETYAELLKIDFPRVPYPSDAYHFRELARLGSELRRVHLLEHPVVDEPLASYRGEGDNSVTRKLTKTSIGFALTDESASTGRVWINDEQYFDGVPEAAWNFYIGGYQPAQKWLKDRRGRKLSYDDIRHYLRIIRALTETERLMGELDGMALAASA